VLYLAAQIAICNPKAAVHGGGKEYQMLISIKVVITIKNRR
jgi:hypothetical protein